MALVVWQLQQQARMIHDFLVLFSLVSPDFLAYLFGLLMIGVVRVSLQQNSQTILFPKTFEYKSLC